MTPPSWSIQIARPARDDMLHAALYIAETLENPQAARRLLDDLEAAIRSLSVLPMRFRLLPLATWRNRGYHAMPVRRYLVVYRVDSSTRTVHVARVFHSSQNWLSTLSSLP